MAKVERYRESVVGLPTSAELARRAEEGWRPVAIEWERASASGRRSVLASTEVPYGLRPAEDGGSLCEAEDEVEAMIAMLELIVQDEPLSRVAEEINRRGFTMRNGSPWTQTAVFQLLPRLVEVGPEVYASERWLELRQKRRQLGLHAVGA